MSQQILKQCMKKGFLVDKETLNLLTKLTEQGAQNVIEALGDINIKERVITKKIFEEHFNKIKTLLIEEQGTNEINTFFEGLNLTKEEKTEQKNNKEQKEEKKPLGSIKLLSAPAFPQRKIEIKDFVTHFKSRYEGIRTILEQKNLENLSSIRKIGHNKGNYTIIAAVIDKRTTKNKNIMIEVEDLTGKNLVLINQNKKELFEKAKDLLLDDIVALEVTGTKDLLFANNITFPEAALQEKKYSDIDEYIAIVGDLHAGSTMYLEKNLLKFIKWVNGEEGNEQQRALARKVKYLFFTGDNIDGVNHYPGQEPHLAEKTTIGQYKKVEEALKLVRKDITMIMIPGQHDAVWVGEPQPIIPEKYAPGLYELKNLHLVPNPSLIEIDGGYKILMYHGASINQLIEEIPEIRLNYGHNSPTRVIKEMIKRSHLAPIHGLMDYIPCEKDPMIINNTPDIIITGDQHRAEIAMKNNILMIAGSCFQSKTPFEEKVGNNPDPCKIPLFNLKTREIKILDFSDEKENQNINIEEETLNNEEKTITTTKT